jgi:predicted transposase/invertase (TIGR01784 family)
MQFVDPKNDLAFRKIFGDDTKKEILISLLNAILDFQNENKITSVEIVNPYQVPKIADLKETILDIKAKNFKGEEFIVEMQKKDLGDFAKRSLYYTSKAYVAQLNRGEDYSNLNKVYFIGIVDFTMFNNKKYVSRHLILNKETLEQDIADFEFTFVELTKFDKQLSELSSVLDKWIYFIKNANTLTMIPKEYANIEEFKEAFTIATQYNWNDKELEVYDYMTMKAWDEVNALKTAEKKGMEKGIEKGMEKGMEKGIEKGMEKGMEKGIEKGAQAEKLKIAKSLLDILDDETIAFKIGLDAKSIEDLRK